LTASTASAEPWRWSAYPARFLAAENISKEVQAEQARGDLADMADDS